jgi:hypothetical protein
MALDTIKATYTQKLEELIHPDGDPYSPQVLDYNAMNRYLLQQREEELQSYAKQWFLLQMD